MPTTRGFVASLIFAIGWLALAFHSRPHLAAAGTDANTALETWTFTPALLKSYEYADTIEHVDRNIGGRLAFISTLTLVGVLSFWGGVALHSRARKDAGATKAVGEFLSACLIFVGPCLPCVVCMGPSGFLFSGPPLATGVVIALITLLSRRLESQS